MKKIYLIVLLSVCANSLYVNEIKDGTVLRFEHVGNPDDDAIIERPCPVYDLNCIRRFFAKHGKCIIKKGPLPDPAYLSEYTLYLSNINLTVTHTNARFTGLNNSRIEEFYINRATNKLVIAIEVRDVSIFVPSSYFRFYRNGREPITAVVRAGIRYSSITNTVVIPNIEDLQFDKAEVTAYAEDSNPPFFVGPEGFNLTNPTEAQAITELLATVPIEVKELMLTETQFYAITYIQNNICDFGVESFI